MSADQLLEEATARHRAGDLAAARELYGRALAQDPAHSVASFRAGLLELQEGRPAAALALIDRAIGAAPDEPRHHFGRGQVLQALNRWDDAASAYRRVLAADPHSVDAHYALGLALQAVGDFAGAAASYEAAIAFQPNFPDAWNNLGNCRQHLTQFEPAVAAYRQSLQLRPSHAGTRANLGTALQALGRLDEAVESLRAAVSAEPGVASHALNLGIALCRQRDFAAAAELLAHAFGRHPASAEIAFNLGIALHGNGDSLGSARHYRHATTLRPDYADAWINLGNVSSELGEFTQAADAYAAAIRAAPDSAIALNNAGCLARTRGRIDEAEDLLRRGLALNPSDAALHDSLGNTLKDAGDVDAAIECFRKALQLNPNSTATHSNLAYSLSFQAATGRPILEECQRWNERFAVPLRAARTAHANDRNPVRRLKIGYVSADFREHCQALFMVPLLGHHDHAQFEIVCYSSVERPDGVTQRLSGMADVWHDVGNLDDAALAERIRADRIDVLVDLTMHMARGRPLLFARKPAPVQLAWLAYPGTTGIDAIDYRLSDPRLDPIGNELPYSERTIRLPDAFWCYEPLAEEPMVNGLPALERGHVTFGCLNNPCKLTEATLELWGAVLGAMPDARLILLAPPGRHRASLLERLSRRGVAGDRISFVPFRPRAAYLGTYHEMDIGLDTIPYNGHTTSLDSLWMGVPVISRIGGTCVGRGGLSQLFQVGLNELAVDTDAAFIAAAAGLGRDLPRLAALRAQLRARLAGSPLMDAARFARNLEDVFRGAWREYCAEVRNLH